MKQPTGTSQILTLLSTHHTLRPAEIHRITGFSRQHIHARLKSLLLAGEIIRKGRAPLTYYSIKKASRHSSEAVLDLTIEQRETLDNDFLLIQKEGHQVTGQRAVCDYAQEHNVDPQQVAEEFLAARDSQLQSLHTQDSGAADQIELLEEKKHVNKGVIERYNFADYSSAGEYGETALAKKLNTAKASDHAVMQLELFRETERQIHEYITEYGIDAVAFIPGTTRAGKAFMKRWKEALDLPLPHVNLVRAVTENGVPQRAISLQADQRVSAEETLAVGDHRRFQHVLILDDEVMTGTTIVQAAEGIQEAQVADRVSAFSLLFSQS